MKSLFVVLPFLLMVQSSCAIEANKTNTIRFTSLSCLIVDPIVIIDLNCSVKAYSRTHSTANFGLTITKNLMKIMIKIMLEYKYGTIFREVLSPPAIEWCSYKQGSNVFYTMVVDLIKDSAPGLIHKCPYFGQVVVQNMTFNVNKFLTVFSQGDYRVTIRFSEGSKTDLFRLIFGINNKSAVKSSFG
ncbi:unnamed protein product [Diamesa tonsa]